MEKSKDIGLIINESKTNYMMFYMKNSQPNNEI